MASPRGLVQWLDQELHREMILPRGGRLMVAVSGGADSVGLLRLLSAVNGSRYWGWTLVVGHVDHGMRGRASAGDARFVRELAAGMGMRFVMRRLRLGKGASENAAREGRLRALSGMMRASRCAAVMMGHQAEDQAETVLMRLMRGCGVEGLCGMGAVNDVGVGKGTVMRIVRPLLGVRRREIRDYLKGIGQDWREDASNARGDYLRNRVRAELLPAMERLWPGAVEAMGRTARLAAEAQGVIEKCVKEVRRGARGKGKKGRVNFRWEDLREAGAFICGEIVRGAVVELGGKMPEFERVHEAVRIIAGGEGGKRVQMGGGVEMGVGRGRVRMERRGR